MEKIPFENNLAETDFRVNKQDYYYLRWFTPEVEIDLCGHSTLATAFVVMNYVDNNLKEISFETKSGRLHVTRNEDLYTMNFPSRMPVPTTVSTMLEKVLGCKILDAYASNTTSISQNANISVIY